MSAKITEGQIDFLGLINEYKDDQGATVRVREPRKTSLPVGNVKTTTRVKAVMPEKKIQRKEEPEQLRIVFEEPKPVMEEPKTKPVVTVAEEPKPVVEEPKPIVEEPKPKPKAAEIKKVTKPKIPIINDSDDSSREKLFKQCNRCWCFDCKHNSRNEAVPREMCGLTMPCPACESCISEDMATICEIGNAKEGCNFRAIEEGIIEPSEEI